MQINIIIVAFRQPLPDRPPRGVDDRIVSATQVVDNTNYFTMHDSTLIYLT